MSKNSSNSSGGGGVGFLGLLTILFIGLKLTGHIEWSWLWVLAPLWIPFAIVLAIGAVVLVARLLETDQQRKVRKAQESLEAFAKRYSGK